MQPVSMLMSHFNVENTIHHTPNALAAAQDTGQGQELVREGIKAVQTVQASEAAAKSQRVKRKNDNDENNENNRDNNGKDGKKKKFDFYG